MNYETKNSRYKQKKKIERRLQSISLFLEACPSKPWHANIRNSNVLSYINKEQPMGSNSPQSLTKLFSKGSLKSIACNCRDSTINKERINKKKNIKY